MAPRVILAGVIIVTAVVIITLGPRRAAKSEFETPGVTGNGSRARGVALDTSPADVRTSRDTEKVLTMDCT